MAKFMPETQVTFAEVDDNYKQFVEKFKPKKTTDECYTPEIVYEAIADWVANYYGFDRSRIVRPFYPGGDYERYPYEPDSIVLDNPPFSIISEIVYFYNANGIKYFLFAPYLTNFVIGRGTECCHFITATAITYDNGATVDTAFVTNLDDRLVVAEPELYKVIKAANEQLKKDEKKHPPKYSYPDNVITAAKIGWIMNKGIRYELKRDDAIFIRELDHQKANGKAIYGGGFLVSDRAANEKKRAEKAAAEKAAAELEAAHKWKLSDRELAIIEALGKRGTK